MPEASSRGTSRAHRWRRTAFATALFSPALLLAACSSSGSDGTPAGSSGAAAGGGPLHIGVLQIATADVVDDTVDSFEKHLMSALAPRQVSFDLKNAQGDQSLIVSLARTFAESKDDGFAVIGTPAVIALAKQVTDRPIIAIAMGDPVGSKVAKSLDAPGTNVTGSIDYVDPAVLLAQIMKVSPAPKRLGTVYDPSNQNMQVWVKALHAAAKAYPGLSIVESTLSGPADVPSAARSLVGRVDAELIGPDATVFAGLAAVGAPAKSNKIPVYVSGGDATVSGILASIGPDYPTVGKLAADAAVKVFTGTAAAAVPYGRPTGVVFAVNKATMTALGITIPTDILATATVQ
jgi:putative ABC transport system substrate-binding protein